MAASWKDGLSGAAVGIAVGVTIAMAGYLLCVSDHASYGLVIFCLLPLLTGFSVGAIVPKGMIEGSIISVALFCSLIFITSGLEGYICVMMAAPIMGTGMAMGAVLGYFLIGKKRLERKQEISKTLLLLIAMPLIMAAAERVERPLRTNQRTEKFVTSIEIAASPEKTWESLNHIPELTGTKPFLLAIGLPVPTSCSMSEAGLGNERVCTFNQGKIVQRTTRWEPGVSLHVAVTESTLPGRRWLQFIDAGYELTPTPTGTRLTRFSSIGSTLYPQWYWSGFEKWGVTSEHTYVLANIKRIAESD